jgi:flagellar biosynthesis protein FliP
MRTLLSAMALWMSLALAPAASGAQEVRDLPMTPASSGPSITLSMPDTNDRQQMSTSLRILLMMTVLSLVPGILISMTSFTRIVIVLTFVRQAIGTQSTPPTQVILALALMLTGVVMAPVLSRIHDQALGPYLDEQIDDSEAYLRASGEIRGFLLRQTREQDLLMFYDLSHTERPSEASGVSLHLLVPAFLVSELRTGFEMGFLLFLPFVLVDLICASVLTAMGMMMMPPTMISTPIKILLFVLVDGWALLVRSLVASFGGPT